MASPSGTATITGKTGIGVTVTALVCADVTDIDFQLAANVIRVTWGTPSRVSFFDLDTIATVTYTIASHVATITIST